MGGDTAYKLAWSFTEKKIKMALLVWPNIEQSLGNGCIPVLPFSYRCVLDVEHSPSALSPHAFLFLEPTSITPFVPLDTFHSHTHGKGQYLKFHIILIS